MKTRIHVLKGKVKHLYCIFELYMIMKSVYYVKNIRVASFKGGMCLTLSVFYIVKVMAVPSRYSALLSEFSLILLSIHKQISSNVLM
jgi:hypothetical protein